MYGNWFSSEIFATTAEELDKGLAIIDEVFATTLVTMAFGSANEDVTSTEICKARL